MGSAAKALLQIAAAKIDNKIFVYVFMFLISRKIQEDAKWKKLCSHQRGLGHLMPARSLTYADCPQAGVATWKPEPPGDVAIRRVEIRAPETQVACANLLQ